jgi:dTDP-glucose 4,6-dehydratase
LTLNRKIPVHEGGSPKRIWLHAKDTAQAIMTVIDKNCENEIFNISGNFEQSNLETVTKIIELYFGKKTENISDFLDLKYKRPGHDFRYLIDDSKIRSLGWYPILEFDKELPSIVEYYKNNFIW